MKKKKEKKQKDKPKKITQQEANREVKKNWKIAEEYASDKEKTGYLLDEALKKAKRHKGILAKCWDNLMTLIRLVRSYFKGEYKDVPLETIIWAIVAIIYFVTPFDLIPDFLPGIGYLDDAAVIGLVIASISNDLKNFREWERNE